MTKNNAVMKILDFQNDDTWQSPIHHRMFHIYLNNREQWFALDIFVKEVEKMPFCRIILSSTAYGITQVY